MLGLLLPPPLARLAWTMPRRFWSVCRGSLSGGVSVAAIGMVLLTLIIAPALRAHDPGLSTADLRLTGEALEAVFAFAPADAQQLASGYSSQAGTDATKALEGALRAAALDWAEIASGGVVLRPSSVRVDTASRDAMKLELIYPLAGSPAFSLRVRGIEKLPAAHRQFVVVTGADSNALVRKFITQDDRLLEVPGAVDAGGGGRKSKPDFLPFVWLGVEHIWTGYDHLLFLLALVIVCRTFRSIVAIVSCFTLAHSVTLCLATFNLVVLPGALVEPLIAASIVFVAIENLVRRGAEPRGRSFLTFAFGLIHGFGFAGVLRELGVAAMPGGAAFPLLGFNLGVELGQIVVAAIALPIVWQLRKSDAFVRHGLPAVSAAVAAAGLYWFFVRTGLL